MANSMAAKESFPKDCTEDELLEYLNQLGANERILEKLKENCVDGAAFLLLTEDDIKELVPLIGDRVFLRSVLKKVIQPSDCQSQKSEKVRQEMTDNYSAHNQIKGTEENWHRIFSIPEKHTFSSSVQSSITTGILCSKSRREISQVLRTLMLQHTRKPTSEQYTEVARKLVEKYPTLNDGGPTGFGVWKLSLRNGFKNFRRDHTDPQLDAAAVGNEKQAKKRKIVDIDGDICDDTYDEAVADLKLEKKKRRGVNYAMVKELMEITLPRRRKWIMEECPLAADILDMFPFLADTKILRREFCTISGSEGFIAFVSSWAEWVEKIVKFAQIEAKTRITLKKLLEEYERESDVPLESDHSDWIVINILLKLLYPKGLPKDTIFVKNFETCDIDFDKAIGEIRQSAPYVAITGIPGKESTQYFVCCEQDVFCESTSLKDTLFDMMAAYYILNIDYPKSMKAVMMFFQHNIFNLKDSQVIPISTAKLVNNLSKMDSLIS